MTKFNRVTREEQLKAGRLYIRSVVGPTGAHFSEVLQVVGPRRTSESGDRVVDVIRYVSEFGKSLGIKETREVAYIEDLGVGPAPTTEKQEFPPTWGVMLVPYTAKALQYLEAVKETAEFVRLILGRHLREVPQMSMQFYEEFRDLLVA